VKILLPIIIIIFVVSLSAQETISEQVRIDLLSAQKRLTAQREKLKAEKIELSTEITKLKAERDMKTRQADLARRSSEGKKDLLKELKGKEYASSIAVDELNQMMKQYGIQLGVKFLPGEAEDARLDSLYEKSDDANSLLEKRFAVIEAGLDRLDKSLGGRLVKATASDESDRILSGYVAQMGPLSWFLSEDKSAAGEYVVSPSGEVASLVSVDKEAVVSLIGGNEATMKIDITGGKATALASLKQGPIELLKKGGAWIYPILGIALVALISAIVKFFQLIKLRHLGSDWTQEVADHYLNGEIDQAAQLAGSPSHPIGKVLPECISAAKSGLEVAEEVLYERMIGVRDGLRSWLPFIAITAATAPMLGLLGTVSGLIRTFSVITVEGTGEAQSISGGISEALVTTMFGLVVAIPALILHSLLSRRSQGIIQTTEKIGLTVVNSIRKNK